MDPSSFHRSLYRPELQTNHPDDREKIVTQPAPSYTLREIARLFSSRVELLPAGESVAEHDQWNEQEKQKVELDRIHEGLFQGTFRKDRQRTHLLSVQDPSDGVDRCPQCLWELEGGECGQCGFNESMPMSVRRIPDTPTDSVGSPFSGSSVDDLHFPVSFDNGYDSFLEDMSVDGDESIGSVENFIDDASTVAATHDTDSDGPVSTTSDESAVSFDTHVQNQAFRTRISTNHSRGHMSNDHAVAGRPPVNATRTTSPADSMPRRGPRQRMIVVSSDSDSDEPIIPVHRHRRNRPSRAVSLSDSDEGPPTHENSEEQHSRNARLNRTISAHNAPDALPLSPVHPNSFRPASVPDRSSRADRQNVANPSTRDNQGHQGNATTHQRSLQPMLRVQLDSSNRTNNNDSGDVSFRPGRPPSPHPTARSNLRLSSAQSPLNDIGAFSTMTPAAGLTSRDRKAQRKRDRRQRIANLFGTAEA